MRIDDVTPSLKSVSVERCNMKESYGLCWRYLDFFLLVFKIVSAKCTPCGLIITKVTLLSMDCKAKKCDYNQCIRTGTNFCL